MKSIKFLIVTLLLPSILNAQVFLEEFDSVTPPNLPTGWSSVAASSSSAWTTTSSFSGTSPNSVFIAIPANVSDVSLTSPVYSYPSAVGPVDATLTFYHRYIITDTINATQSYDGAVLEISINGGPFQDMVTAGGTFTTGEYNYTINSSQNALNTRSVWAGNQPIFDFVSVTLPQIAVGGTFQIRFRMASDVIIGSAGWFIDNIKVEPNIDVSMFLSSDATEAILGKDLIVKSTISNHSSVAVEGFVGYTQSGVNPTVGYSLASGTSTPDGFISAALFSTVLNPGESTEYSITIRPDLNRPAEGIFKIIGPDSTLSLMAIPTTFSPETSFEGITARAESAQDAVGTPFDACDSITTPVAGKIAIVSVASGCSIMTKALNAQAAGAVAVVVEVSSLITPILSEPNDPTLTIPVVSVSEVYFNWLFYPYFFSTPATLQYNVRVRRDILVVHGMASASESNDIYVNDNAMLLELPLITANEYLLKKLDLLKSTVKKINGKNSRAQKTLKQDAKAISNEIKLLTADPASNILTVSSTVNLKKLGGSAKKSVKNLLKSFSSDGKTKVNKAINKLKKSVSL